MHAIKSSALILTSTFLRMLNGLFIIKILAYYTNPTEFGYLSQLMGVIALVGMLASGGIGNGLTRYLSSNEDKMIQRQWLVTALKIYLPLSFLLALILIIRSSEFAISLVGDTKFAIVFVCLAVGQGLIGLSSLTQATASAHKDHMFILKITFIGAFIGALIAVLAVNYYGMIGGAIALVINSSISGLAALLFKRQAIKPLMSDFIKKIDPQKTIQLLKYAVVVLLGATSLAISQIANRNLVAKNFGWEAVGFWQAATKISDSYMQLISVLLVSLVLPRLASHKNIKEMHALFIQICITLSACFIIGSLFIYFFRHILIQILFSNAYIIAADLLLPQLVGDFFRMLAVCLSTALLACAQTKIPMLYEGLQGILTFLFTFVIIKYANVAAPIYAYSITYGILMLFLSFVYYSQLKQKSIN